MTCDTCKQPIRGGYWNIPNPRGPGIVSACRVCKVPPRVPPLGWVVVDRVAEEVRRETRAKDN